MGLLDQFPLSRKQVKSIVESQNVRIAAWSGAVRSGKTIASLVALLLAIADAPPSGLIICAGKTLQTVERNLIEPLMDPALFGPLAYQVHHTRGSNTATIMGRTVHLMGANDARSEGKLRGLTAYLIVLDEATLLPKEFFAQALARLSVPGARLMLTTNPGSPRHWLRQEYLLRGRELNLGHWHFTLDDNPYLDPAYVASLKAEMTGVFYARNIEGRWVAAEGAVYDMWDETRHILRGPVPHLMRLPGVGIDYGTTNAFSAHMLGIAQADASRGLPARLVLAREYRHDPKVAMRQMTDAEFSRELRAWIGPDRPEWVAVDPSAASFKVQLFNDGLSNVVNARNDVLDGIRLFGSLLATGRLVVHESCKGLIDEIGGYSWDPAAAERGEDKPLKIDDHGADSSRYAVATTQASWQFDVPVTAPALAAA